MKIIKKICPICALVSLTWFAMLVLKGFGYQVNETFLAMLMGGSAVGISYTIGKRVNRSEVLWKLFSVPLGFGVMFALINFAWISFFAMAVLYLLLWLLFRRSYNGQLFDSGSSRETDVNSQLKNCC